MEKLLLGGCEFQPSLKCEQLGSYICKQNDRFHLLSDKNASCHNQQLQMRYLLYADNTSVGDSFISVFNHLEQ